MTYFNGILLTFPIPQSLDISALEMHLAGLKEDGFPLPAPTTVAKYIELHPRQAAG